MSYFLGARSCSNLIGVHPELVAVVRRAISTTEQDFAVHCGARTLAAQRQHIANGTSWTLNSKHLRQVDGFAHAVDLVPFVNGELSWDWPGCYLVAAIVASAARSRDIALVWGGVWDRPMTGYPDTAAGVKAASAGYVARRRKLGRRASIDGPHFELPS